MENMGTFDWPSKMPKLELSGLSGAEDCVPEATFPIRD